jgi:hypothetical protein
MRKEREMRESRYLHTRRRLLVYAALEAVVECIASVTSELLYINKDLLEVSVLRRARDGGSPLLLLCAVCRARVSLPASLVGCERARREQKVSHH